MDHIRLVHAVPALVKAAKLGKWTVSRNTWHGALKATVSGVSTVNAERP